MDKQTIIDQLVTLNIPHNPSDHWKTLQKLLGEVRNVDEVSRDERLDALEKAKAETNNAINEALGEDVQPIETGNGKQYVVEPNEEKIAAFEKIYNETIDGLNDLNLLKKAEPTRKDERDSVMTELRDSLKVTQDRAEALHEQYKGNNPSLSRIARNVGITCQRQIKALR